MDTLRKGHAGKQVIKLQELLLQKNFPVACDGIYGTQTFLAVCQFQKQVGLCVDGIVGRGTWKSLLNENPTVIDSENTRVSNKTLPVSLFNYHEAARILGVEEAAIRAVHEVESGGRNGFLKDGRPTILFEGHIFWRELNKRGIDPHQFAENNSDVLFQKWNKLSYKGGAAEYERLEKACMLHEEAALASASWGIFQIMGFNYKLCGYDSVKTYVEAMKENTNNHLIAFVHFIKNTGMDIPLRKLDWAAFAAKYNGPGYQQNQYDKKLENAYRKYKSNL